MIVKEAYQINSSYNTCRVPLTMGIHVYIFFIIREFQLIITIGLEDLV